MYNDEGYPFKTYLHFQLELSPAAEAAGSPAETRQLTTDIRIVKQGNRRASRVLEGKHLMKGNVLHIDYPIGKFRFDSQASYFIDVHLKLKDGNRIVQNLRWQQPLPAMPATAGSPHDTLPPGFALTAEGNWDTNLAKISVEIPSETQAWLQHAQMTVDARFSFPEDNNTRDLQAGTANGIRTKLSVMPEGEAQHTETQTRPFGDNTVLDFVFQVPGFDEQKAYEAQFEVQPVSIQRNRARAVGESDNLHLIWNAQTSSWGNPGKREGVGKFIWKKETQRISGSLMQFDFFLGVDALQQVQEFHADITVSIRHKGRTLLAFFWEGTISRRDFILANGNVVACHPGGDGDSLRISTEILGSG